MRLALALALCAPLVARAADPEAEKAFAAASQAYLEGKYDDAARQYRALAEQGLRSPTLWYDLGNAEYRAGHVGWAVHAYETALKLDPGDADARANLELARKGSVDKVVGEGDAPFFERVVARTPGAPLGAVFSLFWIAFWGALLWRRRANGAQRTAAGAAAIAAACVAALSGVLVAGKAHAERTPAAIIVDATVPVREGPSGSLRVSFELHEGTKVKVLEQEGDFVHVRLPNGLEGWVAKGELAVI